jgi:hypothetical protein
MDEHRLFHNRHIRILQNTPVGSPPPKCCYTKCDTRASNTHEEDYPPVELTAYQRVFATDRHQSVSKDSGEINHIERSFNTLRQRLARFVRKTLSFSKSDRFHEFVFQLFVHHYNRACISQ